MKKFIFFVGAFIVFSVFNYNIYQKETLKNQGEVILLELGVVDPRSLMQGDYMRLAYKALEDSEQIIPARFRRLGKLRACPEGARYRSLVLALDDNRVATFRRFYDGEKLNEKERLFSYYCQHGKIAIMPNAFMFQEGHAERYEKAKYGIFRVDGTGDHILIGLADEKFKTL